MKLNMLYKYIRQVAAWWQYWWRSVYSIGSRILDWQNCSEFIMELDWIEWSLLVAFGDYGHV